MGTETEAARVDAQRLEEFVAELFQRLGVPLEDARSAANSLVFADIHGIASHGVARLDRYVEGLTSGLINPRPCIKTVLEYSGLALLEGDNGLGQVIAVKAMRMAISKASSAGIAAVAVRASNHYGTAGYYALMAIPYGQIGLSLTNGHCRVVPPGGRQAMFGTNPIAVAVPAGAGYDPWLLDMATSVVSRGKIEEAFRSRQLVPEGWAVDGAGLATRDPELILREGANLPLGGTLSLGGHKGYGLAVLIDILSGVLSGANFGGDFRDLWHEKAADNIGHFFLAIQIDHLMPLDAFTARMSHMIDALRSAPTAEGSGAIVIHGQPEFEAARTNHKLGVPLSTFTLARLREIGSQHGVNLL